MSEISVKKGVNANTSGMAHEEFRNLSEMEEIPHPGVPMFPTKAPGLLGRNRSLLIMLGLVLARTLLRRR